MYVHTQITQDNSKAELILYETLWLLFSCNKKYFTKILRTLRPTESAGCYGFRTLTVSWYKWRKEEKMCYLNDKVWQMCYSVLNNITIILSFFNIFFSILMVRFPLCETHLPLIFMPPHTIIIIHHCGDKTQRKAFLNILSKVSPG